MQWKKAQFGDTGGNCVEFGGKERGGLSLSECRRSGWESGDGTMWMKAGSSIPRAEPLIFEEMKKGKRE